MKILDYRHHSLKGPDNFLTPEGIALAIAEGDKCSRRAVPYHKGFHGPLVRTAQTLQAFSYGLGYGPRPMSVIMEIGDDSLLKRIITPDLKTVMSGGLAVFDAILATYKTSQWQEWAEIAVIGIHKMFDSMQNGEIAVAFGHSPIIELAVWHFAIPPKSDKFRQLKEMEGVSLCEYGDEVLITSKILTD